MEKKNKGDILAQIHNCINRLKTYPKKISSFSTLRSNLILFIKADFPNKSDGLAEFI